MKHPFGRADRFVAVAALPLVVVCVAAMVRSGELAAATPAASAGSATSATRAGSAATSVMTSAVVINNYSFHPANLTVSRGSTVTWVNKDDDVHTIKSTDGPEAFNSPALDNGSRFGFTFHQAGTYHYVCSVHPYMHGVVVVR